jgi:hypothetical protein
MANENEANFLGTGWSFPPEFNPHAKSVATATEVDDIKQSLQILLSTTIGERVMQPKYGCNLKELLFESMNTTTKTLILDKIRTAILYFEPRIDAKRIEINSQNELEGELLVEIDFEIRGTNSRFNFVYPFYDIEGTEINFLATF